MWGAVLGPGASLLSISFPRSSNYAGLGLCAFFFLFGGLVFVYSVMLGVVCSDLKVLVLVLLLF